MKRRREEEYGQEDSEEDSQGNGKENREDYKKRIVKRFRAEVEKEDRLRKTIDPTFTEYNENAFCIIFSALLEGDRIFRVALKDDLPTSLSLMGTCSTFHRLAPRYDRVWKELCPPPEKYLRYNVSGSYMMVCAEYDYAALMLERWQIKYGNPEAKAEEGKKRCTDPRYDLVGFCISGTAARHGSFDVLNLFRDVFCNPKAHFETLGFDVRTTCFEANVMEWAELGQREGCNDGSSAAWLIENKSVTRCERTGQLSTAKSESLKREMDDQRPLLDARYQEIYYRSDYANFSPPLRFYRLTDLYVCDALGTSYEDVSNVRGVACYGTKNKSSAMPEEYIKIVARMEEIPNLYELGPNRAFKIDLKDLSVRFSKCRPTDTTMGASEST